MSALRTRLVVLQCTFLFGIGCAGNGPGPSASPTQTGQPATASLERIQTTIFNVHCLSAGCHNGSDRAGSMVLVAGASYASLVNVAPFNGAALMRGLLRVVPGDPQDSFLLVKLTGPPSDEGAGMPFGQPPLSTADIALVRDWILTGAPDSGAPAAVQASRPLPTWTPAAVGAATFTPAAALSGAPIRTPTWTLAPTPTVTPPPPPTAGGSAT
jgi:hypothetical protein